MTNILLAAAFAAVVAAVITWLAARSRSAALEQRATAAEAQVKALEFDFRRVNDANAELRQKLAALEERVEQERKAAAEKLALLEDAKEKLQAAFQALSGEALKSNNQAFLELAKTKLETLQQQAKGELDEKRTAIENLLKPINESLTKVNTELRELEVKRETAYTSLGEQVRSLGEMQAKIQTETGKLVTALRAPQVRGRWGEIQLRRVVELAGMLPYCDFVEQQSTGTEGGRLRPDLIVRLPGGKQVVVDSKTATEAYFDAANAPDDNARAAKLADHARIVRDHITKLSSKSYWEQFQPTPEFVVMFLPGEMFFSAALQQDPGLIEQGVNQRVIPASPTTLIALLRAVAYGWQQERISESAEQISALGKELYERLRSMAEHFEDVGRELGRAVESYNKAVGSFETRVLVTARKFPELGPGVTGAIGELEPIEKAPRELQAPEMKKKPGATQ